MQVEGPRWHEGWGVTDDYIPPFLPLDLMTWHAIPFLVCVTGETCCLDFPLIPCLMDLARGSIAQVSFFWHSVVDRCVRQVTIGRLGTFLVFTQNTDWICQ